jgi:hypothetical protein
MMQEGGLDCVTGLGKYKGRLIILLDVKKVLAARGVGSDPGSGETTATAIGGKAGAQSASAGK